MAYIFYFQVRTANIIYIQPKRITSLSCTLIINNLSTLRFETKSIVTFLSLGMTNCAGGLKETSDLQYLKETSGRIGLSQNNETTYSNYSTEKMRGGGVIKNRFNKTYNGRPTQGMDK